MYTKDMLIGDLLDQNPRLGAFFLEMGMHCLDCPASRGETIAEACEVHDIDCTYFLHTLNNFA